mmetsp:Transcript_11860/g.17791  ORF Transcript_11860/g.17791 Transcript_11860/m.17791 type:complete len:118 (-) Transcript_11860:202-555(-)
MMTLDKQWKRLAEIFSAKLVLEVFGGGGAIWGFSEAIGLRVPHTVWFWRPCALTFGAIFFVRWLMQIRDYMDDNNMEMEFAGMMGANANANANANDNDDEVSMKNQSYRTEKDKLLA